MESLGLDIKMLVAQMVNFGILFFVLGKLLYKPILKTIDDRDKKIKQAVKSSEEIEKRLQKIEEEESFVMEKAKQRGVDEAAEIIKIANEEKIKIIIQTKESAKKEVEKGIERIKAERQKAVEDISQKYIDKVTDVLYNKITKKDKSNYPLIDQLFKQQ